MYILSKTLLDKGPGVDIFICIHVFIYMVPNIIMLVRTEVWTYMHIYLWYISPTTSLLRVMSWIYIYFVAYIF